MRFTSLLLGLAVSAAALGCGDETEPSRQEATTTASLTSEYELPAADVDAGVIAIVELPIEQIDALSRERSTETPTAVAFEIDECRQWAPNRWIIGGAAIATGDEPVELVVAVGWRQDDVVSIAWFGRATVRESGRFEFGFIRRGFNFEDDSVTLAPLVQSWDEDTASACSLMTVGSDGFDEDYEDYDEVETTIDERPVEYTAPAGSVQALGIGARMNDPYDPRRTWAYMAWDELPLPFETVWVPTDPLMGFSHAEGDDDRCPAISMSGSRGQVIEKPAGCGLPNDGDRLTDEVVASHPDFRWADLEWEGAAALATLGEVEVLVFAPDRDGVISIIASLTELRNVNIGAVPASFD